MHRTQSALFGVLGVHGAFSVLRVAHQVSLRAALSGDLTEKTRPMSSVLWDFAILNFALASVNVVFFVLYAHSVRRTPAARMANAAWVMVLVQLALGVGMPVLNETYSDEGRSLLLLALVALLYWVQLGVFCTSVYRIVDPEGPPFYRGYTKVLVGLAVVQSLFGWLDDGISVTPMDLGAVAPAPAPVVTGPMQWLWYGLQVLSVGVFSAFVWGATRRLPREPPTDTRVFD